MALLDTATDEIDAFDEGLKEHDFLDHLEDARHLETHFSETVVSNGQATRFL